MNDPTSNASTLAQRIEQLQQENDRLVALLEVHGVEWRLRPKDSPAPSKPIPLSTDQKVAIFRSLFRGRTDVYPTRWESKTTGKSGYSPACANERRTGICEKGHSIFVDAELHPYQDQWAFLSSVKLMTPCDIEPIILRATGNAPALDVLLTDAISYEPSQWA